MTVHQYKYVALYSRRLASIFTHAHTAFCEIYIIFDLKKYAHSEKIIPFSESTFKIYVMLGRALFLTLLAL